MTAAAHAEEHHEINYVKIWAILVVLLCISVVGPLFGHPLVTLFTAFGIAIIKAYLVVVNFMHLPLTPRFVTYFVSTALVFMLLLFAGVAPDVMKKEGANWEKPAWIQAAADFEASGGHGGHGAHGGGHASGHAAEGEAHH